MKCHTQELGKVTRAYTLLLRLLLSSEEIRRIFYRQTNQLSDEASLEADKQHQDTGSIWPYTKLHIPS